jgi:twitching motility protein PilT
MATQMEELLQLVITREASDLHLIAGSLPVLRINGELVSLTKYSALKAETVKSLVFSILSETQRGLLLNNRELDFSFDFGDRGRFRVNAYFQKGSVAAALRLIPYKIKTIDELRLPKIVHQFAKLRQGFVLVTGPTGHGKSSTLAAIIDEINSTRPVHVVTVEDPIEFVYQPKKAYISQRELHSDTHSWKVALRSVLREDPDVVLVGEMRDYETIAAAITVAETGHLVLATLHTNSAAQTVNRVIDVFPEHQQAQVRMQLAASLEAILSERLVPSLKGGRVPAVEVLLATPAVRNTIREGKTHQLDNVILTSGELGMVSLEASLAGWVRSGEVSVDVAKAFALRPNELVRLTQSR